MDCCKISIPHDDEDEPVWRRTFDGYEDMMLGWAIFKVGAKSPTFKASIDQWYGDMYRRAYKMCWRMMSQRENVRKRNHTTAFESDLTARMFGSDSDV